jgi:hypothetical protein
MPVGDPIEINQNVAGFGLGDAWAGNQGSTGTLCEDEEKGEWVWTVTGRSTSREFADKQMRAAMDGAEVIEGKDIRGVPVGDRRKS